MQAMIQTARRPEFAARTAARNSADDAARLATLRDFLWSEAAEAPGLDSDIWRVDRDCRLMRYGNFGDQISPFGWTADFRGPAAVNYSSALSES